jgi:DMSO/TMAO reductase YedYZ molybdopterin-dependent catalytic subunit
LSPLSRRDFLTSAAFLPTAARAFLHQSSDARYVSTIPLGNPGNVPSAPLERLLGSSLDARLFTDLSDLGRSSASAFRTPQSAVVTPNARYYIRTARPAALPDARGWRIPVAGMVAAASSVAVDDLERSATTIGPCVMECAGNADPANFGLLSAAAWEGVPLTSVLDRVKPSGRGPYRVLVRGVDDSGPSMTSVPGASWIFSRDELQRALLAVRMNGASLPPDHGLPVRLVVPGWYGCACIKWVDLIELVGDDARATTQMREFAARTHQALDTPEAVRALTDGTALARDFIPAVIDTAAMPVRVEKWINGGRVEYRVVGILWGGMFSPGPTNALSIRFRGNGPWARVDDCPMPASTLTWSVWTHTWRPTETGRYQIVLRVDDPAIRTRRLDLFFYVREINIDEV